MGLCVWGLIGSCPAPRPAFTGAASDLVAAVAELEEKVGDPNAQQYGVDREKLCLAKSPWAAQRQTLVYLSKLEKKKLAPYSKFGQVDF